MYYKLNNDILYELYYYFKIAHMHIVMSTV